MKTRFGDLSNKKEIHISKLKHLHMDPEDTMTNRVSSHMFGKHISKKMAMLKKEEEAIQKELKQHHSDTVKRGLQCLYSRVHKEASQINHNVNSYGHEVHHNRGTPHGHTLTPSLVAARSKKHSRR